MAQPPFEELRVDSKLQLLPLATLLYNNTYMYYCTKV